MQLALLELAITHIRGYRSTRNNQTKLAMQLDILIEELYLVAEVRDIRLALVNAFLTNVQWSKFDLCGQLCNIWNVVLVIGPARSIQCTAC